MTTPIHEFIRSNHWVFILILIIALCDGILKLIAMWKASRNNQVVWFVLLAIINSVGILPVIYILTHRNKHKK